MHTWVFDETGSAGAIVDEFCVRTTLGEPAAWVFGMSLFAITGEHIGWYEDGVFFDVHNKVLGFFAGAAGLPHDFPVPLAPPPMPPLSKRPNVPPLLGRPARPARGGWSACSLADYLERYTAPRSCAAGALLVRPRRPGWSAGNSSH